MDSVRGGKSMIAKNEDRISNLPDDIIHHILSFLDMKYVMQTSTLSHRWEHIWTSMPVLSLHSHMFGTLTKFSEFINHVLSHRNHSVDVYGVNLTFGGAFKEDFVKNVVNYAYSHNVEELSMIGTINDFKLYEFPKCVFSSHSLKHLTLASNGVYCNGGHVPTSAWDFPVLETMYLYKLYFRGCGDESLNLFSKCVNLKDLVLDTCSITDVNIFNVCAAHLVNLTITDSSELPKAFNLVTPQLENLTASVITILDNPQKIYSKFLQLYTKDMHSLEKVSLCLSQRTRDKKDCVPYLLHLFERLRNAKSLVLDMYIIEVLSLCLKPHSRSLEPCPFNNLKCLKIIDDSIWFGNWQIAILISPVIKYFLESSPTATITIIDTSQVSEKRSGRIKIDHQTQVTPS